MRVQITRGKISAGSAGCCSGVGCVMNTLCTSFKTVHKSSVLSKYSVRIELSVLYPLQVVYFQSQVFLDETENIHLQEGLLAADPAASPAGNKR